MINVVVVDDHPIFRAGLIQAISTEGDIHVVGEGESGEEALELVCVLEPDILLLDAWMKDSGLSHVREIVMARASTRVVMVTASENQDDIAKALEAGVSGYVLKGTTGPEMRSIIRAIHAGENYIPPGLLGLLLNVLQEKSVEQHQYDVSAKLSRQETQVLQQLSYGLSNKEIGQRLSVTERTIKFHLSNIFAKLGVRNRVEASIIARKMWKDLE